MQFSGGVGDVYLESDRGRVGIGEFESLGDLAIKGAYTSVSILCAGVTMAAGASGGRGAGTKY